MTENNKVIPATVPWRNRLRYIVISCFACSVLVQVALRNGNANETSRLVVEMGMLTLSGTILLYIGGSVLDILKFLKPGVSGILDNVDVTTPITVHSWKKRRIAVYLAMAYYTYTIYYCLGIVSTVLTETAVQYSFLSILVIGGSYVLGAIIEKDATRNTCHKG